MDTPCLLIQAISGLIAVENDPGLSLALAIIYILTYCHLKIVIFAKSRRLLNFLAILASHNSPINLQNTHIFGFAGTVTLERIRHKQLSVLSWHSFKIWNFFNFTTSVDKYWYYNHYWFFKELEPIAIIYVKMLPNWLNIWAKWGKNWLIICQWVIYADSNNAITSAVYRIFLWNKKQWIAVKIVFLVMDAFTKSSAKIEIFSKIFDF